VARVVIVGGGVIGCAVAERLSLGHHHVTLLERDQLGCRASGAAAGELSPFGSSETMASRSLTMFPELVARIERDSGIVVEYHMREALQPALDDNDIARLKPGASAWLDGDECRRLEPSLAPEALGAVLLREGHITPPRFVRALARAAASRGADIREGAPATGFDVAGGMVRRVMSPAGPFEADWVVIAAGPWSKAVAASAGASVEVRPQRGQLAALNAGTTVLNRTIFWSSGYLVPKPDGSIIVGGTEEDSGFDDRPTAAGVAALLQLASRLVPDLGSAVVERVWAGLRPITADGTPIVRVVGPANLIAAAGHGRKGILLAPLAAETVSALIS